MRDEDIHTGDWPIRDAFDVFQHGDAKSVSVATNITEQHVRQWNTFEKRNPASTMVMAIEQLRRNGNPQADVPFQMAAHRLGYALVPLTATQTDDAQFAGVLRSIADVVDSKSQAEIDGHVTAEEHKDTAKTALAAAEKLIAFSRKQDELAEAKSHSNVRRIAR